MVSTLGEEVEMGRYVMIESRDPYESRDVPYFYSLAAELAAKGEQVTLFLVQNGALASRKDAKGDPLGAVLQSKAQVLADSFSLRERGIQDSDRHPSVKPAEIGSLVEAILAEGGTKVLWH
jgi:sulfur relay (sulfurtransferase) complex TusBCD TusD component (DsrE family)